MKEQTAIAELEDCRLLAATREYILKLEVCSLCDRVTTCEPTLDGHGWRCVGVGCRVRRL